MQNPNYMFHRRRELIKYKEKAKILAQSVDPEQMQLGKELVNKNDGFLFGLIRTIKSKSLCLTDLIEAMNYHLLTSKHDFDIQRVKNDTLLIDVIPDFFLEKIYLSFIDSCPQMNEDEIEYMAEEWRTYEMMHPNKYLYVKDDMELGTLLFKFLHKISGIFVFYNEKPIIENRIVIKTEKYAHESYEKLFERIWENPGESDPYVDFIATIIGEDLEINDDTFEI